MWDLLLTVTVWLAFLIIVWWCIKSAVDHTRHTVSLGGLVWKFVLAIVTSVSDEVRRSRNRRKARRSRGR